MSTNGGKALLDQITITLKNDITGDLFPVYIDVHDSSLSKKWLAALNDLLANNYHLEKNFCFLGFVESSRNVQYILNQINNSISAINSADIGYSIDDYFTIENTVVAGDVGEHLEGGKLIKDKMNQLHRYFEDLQGTSGNMSGYYTKADNVTRWHIRQLNLLCHEYESLILSIRKSIHAPEWRRPSQLMCWLHAPRFELDEDDYDLFGVDTIARPLGGIFVGVNKAVGKHHWEVFQDEGRDSRVGELVTSAMKSQSEAAGDFDIEWANNPGQYKWMQDELDNFRQWLIENGFDPDDKSLTIGHPQVGQVDLFKTFGTSDHNIIWKILGQHLNVHSIETSDQYVRYNYDWFDTDYMHAQIEVIEQARI